MSHLYLLLDTALHRKRVFVLIIVWQGSLWRHRSAHAANCGAKGLTRLSQESCQGSSHVFLVCSFYISSYLRSPLIIGKC